MPAIEIKKRDWKLFRERLPGWQEKYMEKLVAEYAAYLQRDAPASTKIWEMEIRIKEDKRRPGVLLSLEKKNVDVDLMRLMKDCAIEEKDLEGFWLDLIDRVIELSGVDW